MIPSGPAVNCVGARTAPELIVACTALQPVIACMSIEPVVTIVASQVIVVPRTIQTLDSGEGVAGRVSTGRGSGGEIHRHPSSEWK